MTEMFGEAWSPMSVPDLAPDDDDDDIEYILLYNRQKSVIFGDYQWAKNCQIFSMYTVELLCFSTVLFLLLLLWCR